MSRVRLLCAAVGLLAAGGASAQSTQAGLYLFRIPTSATVEIGQDSNAPLRVELTVADPARLQERFASTSVAVTGVGARSVRVEADQRETLSGEPALAHRAASFVIDFDEPPVAALSDSLRAAGAAPPTLAALVEFVATSIGHKTYRRGFDVASQVARSREGDCTEHAVLLAALARAGGRPARVVLGILLVETSGRVMAFGHAWTEIHDGATWQIADATQPERQLGEARFRYLPVMELANEGPGYAMGMLDMAQLFPERVEVNGADSG